MPSKVKSGSKTRRAAPVKDMKPKKDAKAGRTADGNTVYISTAGGGVWKTTNG